MYSVRLYSTRCLCGKPDGDNGSKGDGGLYCRSKEVGLHKEGVKILCRNTVEMGGTSVDRLLDVINSGRMDLNVFSGAMERVKDYRELAQLAVEQMIMTNAIQKRTLRKSV